MTWAEYKALWQEIDHRVAAGEFTSDEAVAAARRTGLVAEPVSPHLPQEVRDVLAFVPESYLAYRPWLMVVFAGEKTPRVYRPATEPLMRRD